MPPQLGVALAGYRTLKLSGALTPLRHFRYITVKCPSCHTQFLVDTFTKFSHILQCKLKMFSTEEQTWFGTHLWFGSTVWKLTFLLTSHNINDNLIVLRNIKANRFFLALGIKLLWFGSEMFGGFRGDTNSGLCLLCSFCYISEMCCEKDGTKHVNVH